MTLLLDKPKVQKEADAALPQEEVKEYHWTVDALYRALDAGVFEHPERLELIQGRIVETMGQGPRHATLATEIAEMLREAFGKRFAIREEKPVRLGNDSELIPDVMVLKGRQADYNGHQPIPEDVPLLVEVSVTTVEYDLGDKALQYAQSGITDYWVVVEKENVIVQHREPSANGYQSVTRLAEADTISPLAAPEIVWTVKTLIGREEAPKEN